MRLYPPVLLNSKHALHNDVPPYHPYAMGRRDAIWDTYCLEFKPERWLNKDGHFIPQSPFKFEVFHQGSAHLCLGKDMAFMMKYVAATVVSMFKLQRLVEYSAMGNSKLIQNLTARMKGGFPVLLEKKNVDW